MKKYIDADALMTLLKESGDELFEIDEIAEAVDMLPAADVEPVRHGEWKGECWWYCSICNGTVGSAKEKYNYCPHCGAKMDGGSE